MNSCHDIRVRALATPSEGFLGEAHTAQEELLLGYVASGELELELGPGCSIHILEGTAFWRMPGLSYPRIMGAARCRVMGVAASGGRVARIVAAGLLPGSSFGHIAIVNTAELTHLFEAVLALAKEHDGAKARLGVLFETLCYRIKQSAQKLAQVAETSETRVLRLARTMEANPCGPYDWRQSARSCGLSYTHFRRLFQKLCGLPPREFLIDCRMKHATRALLKSPTLTVAQVANRLGYGSPCHFSQLYRKRMGCAPGLVARKRILDPAALAAQGMR
jgi:AraC-like DNA-binding protein